MTDNKYLRGPQSLASAQSIARLEERVKHEKEQRERVEVSLRTLEVDLKVAISQSTSDSKREIELLRADLAPLIAAVNKGSGAVAILAGAAGAVGALSTSLLSFFLGKI